MKTTLIKPILALVALIILGVACGDLGNRLFLDLPEDDVSAAFKAQPIDAAPSNDTEAQLLRDVTAKWAPEVRMHPQEQYPLADVNEYLKYVGLFSQYGSQKLVHVLPGRLTTSGPNGLLSQIIDVGGGKYEVSGGDYTKSGLEKLWLYIPPDAYSDVSRGTGIAASITQNPKCYAYPHFVDNKSAIEINYWFFYPFNGAVYSGIAGVGIILQDSAAGTHEGDWEHMTVRLSGNGQKLQGVFYSAHGAAESHWYYKQSTDMSDKNGYKMNSKGQPIGWSARDTHGMYNTAGAQARNPGGTLGDIVETSGALVDYTADGGKVIDCRTHLATFDFSNLSPDLQWVFYRGRMGSVPKVGSSVGEDGPINISRKGSWIKEENFDQSQVVNP